VKEDSLEDLRGDRPSSIPTDPSPFMTWLRQGSR
jgi:hypothetical protein